jgi:hypothetical protein
MKKSRNMFFVRPLPGADLDKLVDEITKMIMEEAEAAGVEVWKGDEPRRTPTKPKKKKARKKK